MEAIEAALPRRTRRIRQARTDYPHYFRCEDRRSQFFQVKEVVDKSTVIFEDEAEELENETPNQPKLMRTNARFMTQKTYSP